MGKTSYLLHKSKGLQYYWFITGLLTFVAIIYTIHGSINLINGENLPVDLALRYWHTKKLFFFNENIFLLAEHPLYPPSFFVFLYPLFAWTNYYFADKVWLFINLALISTIVTWLFQISGSNLKARPIKYLLPLSFLCIHAIAHGLGIGQVTLFVIGGFSIYLFIKTKKFNSPIYKIISVLSLTIALNKYSLFLPFSIILFIKKEFRIDIIFAVFINLFLSIWVMHFVDSNLLFFFNSLIENSGYVNSLGSLDIQSFISFLGFSKTYLIISIITISTLFTGIIIKNGKLSFFDQLALAALTARFFIYHAHYDNVILVFLLIALWKRIPQFETLSKELILYGLIVLSLIIPARFLEWHAPYYGVFLMYQLVIWIYSGYFLLRNNQNS